MSTRPTQAQRCHPVAKPLRVASRFRTPLSPARTGLITPFSEGMELTHRTMQPVKPRYPVPLQHPTEGGAGPGPAPSCSIAVRIQRRDNCLVAWRKQSSFTELSSSSYRRRV